MSKNEVRIYQGLKAISEKLVKQTPEPNAEGITERWVKAPETITYSVYIDWKQVQDMALKAAKNKSERSTDGPLSVRITRRKDGYGH